MSHDDIKAALEAATPRPWHAWDRGIGYEVHVGPDCEVTPDARKHPEWANPTSEATQKAVELFQHDFQWCARITVDEVRRELGGHDLMCWCPLGQVCHATVLLDLANQGGEQM